MAQSVTDFSDDFVRKDRAAVPKFQLQANNSLGGKLEEWRRFEACIMSL